MDIVSIWMFLKEVLGCASEDPSPWGWYWHGIFDNDYCRRENILVKLRTKASPTTGTHRHNHTRDLDVRGVEGIWEGEGKGNSEKKVEEGRGGEKRATWTIEITKPGETKTSQRRRSNISVERPTECWCESKWIWDATLLILFLVSQLRIGLFRFLAIWRVLHPALLVLSMCLGKALRLALGFWLCYVSRVPRPT